MKIGDKDDYKNAVELKSGDKKWNFIHDEVTPVEAELIIH